ncbi:ATP-grasp domain-containing protein [Methanobrevibacter sp. TMH8]|uniref:ATP-grasp domain-containing protein n=1 Tax=Methanobrevibacter sp. TMH8 TaxID=2848611 RepID=UPI001CCC1DBB|nr:ATP-grasp domain-containing protein [Methanobrevibacter sp. TMH8]MBZ9570348.1 ATP-grasp domain-containing protein [Methanobrevibacter sp. TMH8]
MEKLLIIGINTRSLLNSASKLNFCTYSTSYFFTADSKRIYKEKHVLKQIPGKSCGIFEEDYNPEKLLELSLEFMEEVDKIILSGISPNIFKGNYKKFRKKIIGNHDVDTVENKYKFYKKIRNDFLVPKTYKIDYDHIDEIVDILNQHSDTSFITKPLQGSGGYGVKYLDYTKKHYFNDSYFENYFSEYEGETFLFQEFIEGDNISSSVLSTKKQAQNIINSKMLTESNFGENNFKYSGNIVPYTNILKSNTNSANEINDKEIKDISEKIISKFSLVGSNGVDMIIKNDKNKNEEIYIIEANPRFQGTYECVEKVLGINLLDAHIKAYDGELINIPNTNGYSMKKIIYTKERIKVGDLFIDNVYDIPYNGVIIEKDQPLSTIISYDKNIKNTKNKLKKAIFDVNKNIYSYH